MIDHFFKNQSWLPSHFRHLTLLTAWKAGKKIGGELIK
eukprot:SAG31_NODE_12500_length_936_cov_10.360812_2_plen_37_part_01